MTTETQPLNELLDEIEQYCESATPEPWIAEGSQIARRLGNERSVNDHMIVRDAGMWRENETFIARARTDLPRLVKELRERIETENAVNQAWERAKTSFDEITSNLHVKVAELEAERDATATRMKEELIKKVREREKHWQDEAAANYNTSRSKYRRFSQYSQAVSGIADLLEKVEIK